MIRRVIKRTNPARLKQAERRERMMMRRLVRIESRLCKLAIGLGVDVKRRHR